MKAKIQTFLFDICGWLKPNLYKFHAQEARKMLKPVNHHIQTIQDLFAALVVPNAQNLILLFDII